jgi:transcriptional regulator GlxA family with amidase domain
MKVVNPKKHLSTINQIAQYIYDNVEEAMSLDSLARQFSVSKYHLNRLFFCTNGNEPWRVYAKAPNGISI